MQCCVSSKVDYHFIVCLCLNAEAGNLSVDKSLLGFGGLVCFFGLLFTWQQPAEWPICDVTAFASPPPPSTTFLAFLESTSHGCLYVSSATFSGLTPPPSSPAALAHQLTAFTDVGERKPPPDQWKWRLFQRNVEDKCQCCPLGNWERHLSGHGFIIYNYLATWWVIDPCRQRRHVRWYVRTFF